MLGKQSQGTGLTLREPSLRGDTQPLSSGSPQSDGGDPVSALQEFPVWWERPSPFPQGAPSLREGTQSLSSESPQSDGGGSVPSLKESLV